MQGPLSTAEQAEAGPAQQGGLASASSGTPLSGCSNLVQPQTAACFPLPSWVLRVSSPSLRPTQIAPSSSPASFLFLP